MTRTSSRYSRLAACAGVLLAAAANPLLVRAQEPDPLGRLDPNTRFVVEVIIDSARVSGVPTRPLTLKALEGSAKHADNRHIIAAVRSVFHAELDVRVALGSELSEAEWSAAAAALQSGLPLETLARFRGSHDGKPLMSALVVLTDLIQRGVPVSEASSAIQELWQKGAGETDFYGLRKNVVQDILSGQNPGTALQNRVREIPVRVAPGSNIPPASQEPDNSSS